MHPRRISTIHTSTNQDLLPNVSRPKLPIGRYEPDTLDNAVSFLHNMKYSIYLKIKR